MLVNGHRHYLNLRPGLPLGDLLPRLDPLTGESSDDHLVRGLRPNPATRGPHGAADVEGRGLGGRKLSEGGCVGNPDGGELDCVHRRR